MRQPKTTLKRIPFIFISFLLSISFLYGEDFSFDSAGIRIHYTIEGKGEPVLVIHGLGQNIRSMAGIIKPVSDNFQVIAMDVRGHG